MFFHYPLQAIHCIAYVHIAARYFQSSHNAKRVYIHSFWLANLANFCTTNSNPVLARERWQNNTSYIEKTQFFLTTLYMALEILKTLIYIFWFKMEDVSTFLFNITSLAWGIILKNCLYIRNNIKDNVKKTRHQKQRTSRTTDSLSEKRG